MIEIPAITITGIPAGLLLSGPGLHAYEDVFRDVWTAKECDAWAPPPDMTVSEWADQNRVLSSRTSRKAGPWRTDYTPYLRPIMDAYTLKWLRHLVVCAGTQLGKSEAMYNILGYTIDIDQAPTLWMVPRDDDVKLTSDTRIKPMIEDSPVLRDKKPIKGKDYKIDQMSFPGMILYLVGANSLAGLASKPCRNIFRDERDKMTAVLADGSDAPSKSSERAKDWWDVRKEVDVSSPTFENRGILKELAKCDIINVIHHPCPHCGLLIRLYPTQIKWDVPADHPKRSSVAKDTAYYVCQRCGGVIENRHRARMIADFEYVQQRNITFGIDNEGNNEPLGELDFQPESMGFWISSLSSPMLTWGDVAKAFLDAEKHRDETGETGPLQTVINDWYAEPWLVGAKTSTESEILKRRKEREPLVVPSWAYALTAGFDPQKFGVWQAIWAWGPDYRSAMIDARLLPTWDDVNRVVFDTDYQVEGSQERMMIWRAGMDIGGGKDSFIEEDWTKTEEILNFIRENGRGVIFPVKGASVNSSGQAVRHSILDKMPGGSIIPGGLALWLIDTFIFKEMLFWRLSQGDNDPQPVELHRLTDKVFIEQILAEEKVRKKNGQIVYERKRKDNHLLDCSVYASACAHFQWLGGIKMLSGPIYGRAKQIEKVIAIEDRPADLRDTVRGFTRPDWLRRGRG